jgi:ribosome-binding protein aMBF1 (putative translation factor)
MKLSETKTAAQVVEEHRQADPEFRQEWDREAFARAVAAQVVKYRGEQGLSQRQLAQLTGITQPAIARLEAGEVVPELKTLARLTAATGLEFRLSVAHGEVALGVA